MDASFCRTEVRTYSFTRVASNLRHLLNFLKFCEVKGRVRISISNNEFQLLCEMITECSFCYLHLDKVWSVVFKINAFLELSRHSNYGSVERLAKVFSQWMCVASMENSRYSSWMLIACLMPTWVQPGPPSLKLIKYACTLILKILRKDGTRASYDQVNKVAE